MARPREFDEAEAVQRATEVFWAKGLRNTSPKDLLEATGLSKGSLYNAFGSKRGLFERALHRYTVDNCAYMSQLLADGTLRDGLERLYAQLLDTSTPVADGGQGRSCLVCSASIEVEQGETELMELVQQARANLIAIFQRRLDRAVAEGELAADTDTRSRAEFLFTVNMGLVVQARAHTPLARLRAVADHSIDTVCA